MTSETITVNSLIQKQMELINRYQTIIEDIIKAPGATNTESQRVRGVTPEGLQTLCNVLKILQECKSQDISSV